jgi:hypothetical protein
MAAVLQEMKGLTVFVCYGFAGLKPLALGDRGVSTGFETRANVVSVDSRIGSPYATVVWTDELQSFWKDDAIL